MSLKAYFSDKPRGFQAEFARKIGISPSFLSQIISGKSKAPPSVAVALKKTQKSKLKNLKFCLMFTESNLTNY